MTKDEALTLEALKYAASKGYGRIVREMKIAPFTIKCEEALAHPEQEPVALVIDGVLVKSSLPEKYTGHLYTHPPQRKWVGLTNQEQLDIFAQSVAKKRSDYKHYKAIEQALKEKNQ